MLHVFMPLYNKKGTEAPLVCC